MIVFETTPDGLPVLGSGAPVTCDGCGTVLNRQPGPDQQRPIPADVARRVYGREPGELAYVVCPRGADCLTLAALADDLYDLLRCRVPGCRGERCRVPQERAVR